MNRIPLDHLTSDDLDQLYDRLEDDQKVIAHLESAEQRAEQLAATLREVLAAYDATGCLSPTKYREWTAVLDQPNPLTDADGRTICTCTHDTPCGCGTSVHYVTKEQP